MHELMSLDGVIDAPTWSFDYGFDPQTGGAIGAVTERCRGILLGRRKREDAASGAETTNATSPQRPVGAGPVVRPADWRKLDRFSDEFCADQGS